MMCLTFDETPFDTEPFDAPEPTPLTHDQRVVWGILTYKEPTVTFAVGGRPTTTLSRGDFNVTVTHRDDYRGY